MGKIRERSEFNKTLLKDLKKPDREQFLLSEIKKIEESQEYISLQNAKADKSHVDDQIFKIKQVYPNPESIEETPTPVRLRFNWLKKRAFDLQNLINQLKPISIKLKSLKEQLRIINEDTRAKYFIEVSKGYLSKETFIEIWSKANQMYEESVLEICQKSMDELRKEDYAN